MGDREPGKQPAAVEGERAAAAEGPGNLEAAAAQGDGALEEAIGSTRSTRVECPTPSPEGTEDMPRLAGEGLFHPSVAQGPHENVRARTLRTASMAALVLPSRAPGTALLSLSAVK